MGVTINDIAKIARVSPSTVSRVIANNPRISATTCEKVHKIMREMNYHPNMIARSLANRSTKIIGLVVHGTTEKAFEHPFIPEAMRGIISAAHKKGYKTLISSAADVAEERCLINDLAKGGIVEGIILTSSRRKDPSIQELKKQMFPFVLIGRPVNDEEVNWVDNNNFSIAYDLTRHFIEQGHEKIVFLGYSSNFVVTQDRLEGYKKALEDAGLSFDINLVVEGKFIDDSGYELMKELMNRNLKFTGVIACDDFLAFGAMKFLSENGLSIPDDIAIAGFNNTSLAEHYIPSLTSVDVNAYSLGSNAFELLINSIHNKYKSYNRAIVPARIVIRGSSITGS